MVNGLSSENCHICNHALETFTKSAPDFLLKMNSNFQFHHNKISVIANNPKFIVWKLNNLPLSLDAQRDLIFQYECNILLIVSLAQILNITENILERKHKGNTKSPLQWLCGMTSVGLLKKVALLKNFCGRFILSPLLFGPFPMLIIPRVSNPFPPTNIK